MISLDDKFSPLFSLFDELIYYFLVIIFNKKINDYMLYVFVVQ